MEGQSLARRIDEARDRQARNRRLAEEQHSEWQRLVGPDQQLVHGPFESETFEAPCQGCGRCKFGSVVPCPSQSPEFIAAEKGRLAGTELGLDGEQQF